MANEPRSTPAERRSSSSRLTCELSKSFSPLAAVGAVGLYGNGTLPVSWFTNSSTSWWPRFRTEIPSGIDSKRYPLRSVSPTVRSGLTAVPGITGVSIDG